MAMMKRPIVTATEDGGKYWEHTFEKFHLKAYVPATKVDGTVNNYTFRAPLLLVFEEKKQTMEQAIRFAEESGLACVAAAVDSSVLFVYPTAEDGWRSQTADLYASVIEQVKMDPNYKDGIVELTNFFTREFQGYFIRGAIFRADIYSFGESADYVAKNLLTTLQGQYLWGPGEITPAMCSMERLSVIPKAERKDIGILSVKNSAEINAAFAECENLLVKQEADYPADFKSFVRKFKMWCGNLEIEPDFEAMDMTEEAGCITVKTSADSRRFQGMAEHKVGYFTYYNNDVFDKGPAPLLVGFHGGGDSSMFLTFVSGWYEICHRYGFLYVALDNHQDVTATEAADFIQQLQKKYSIDEKRIYATGFSMGSGKTWEMFQEYPELFAGLAPASALFPVKENPMAQSRGGRFNETVSVPIFYSGGEKSHLPELPFQADSALERIQYAAKVNRLKASFADLSYEEKENWTEPVYGAVADRVEQIIDKSRNSCLTIRYYDSEDGICRTAFASVSGQVHECRHHTNEQAWKFISQFTK